MQTIPLRLSEKCVWGALGLVGFIGLWAALSALGILLLFATLHIARGVAHVHGAIAKHLLVKWGE